MICVRSFFFVLLTCHSAFLSTHRTLLAQSEEVVIPQTPQAWMQAARSDIEAAYRILADNHPGMVDPANPNFPTLLNQARLNALSLVPRVDGPAPYMFTIDRFTATLQDGHAGVFARLPQEVDWKSRWPGFLVTWRGDGLLVHHSEEANVPVGARILNCDGQSIDTLMRERVFAFQHGLDQPGIWWSDGRNLLLDHGNPFLEPLKRCEIQTPDGQHRQIVLEWRSLPESAQRFIWSVTNGDRLPVGLQWREDRWPWVAMPTFQPDESEVQAYDELIQAIESQRERLLAAPAIVLDLRHNQGGNSQWSVRVASALWGAGRVERRRAALYARTQTLWRASQENTNHVESLAEQLKEAGMTELLPEIRRIGDGMRTALAKGEPFFNEDAQNDTESKPSMQEASRDLDSDPPPLTAPVFVIVPPQCASAGLDAIDTFKLFPNTRLIGAPSSADSTYMEIRLQDLPSGLGKVIVPNKVYVNRPRGNGEYYTPDILHTALDWSTEAFLTRVQTAVAQSNAASPELLLVQKGFLALEAKKTAEARQALNELLVANPEPWVHVLIAKSWSLDGKQDEAFQSLQSALEGFEKDPISAGPLCCDLAEELERNDTWESIRSDGRFEKLLARARKATWHPKVLVFDASTGSNPPRFPRPSTDSNRLKVLRESYQLDTVIAEATDDLDRVKRMCRWVHDRTSHDGWSDDYPTDALDLLKAAEKGSQWRCVEFGIVVAECLQSVGIPARRVSAQARDVETMLGGAGHVFSEAWLEDRQCWIFVDAQMDLVGLDRDGSPLNSVQFRNALARADFPIEYPKPLAMCMHYFHFAGFPGERNLMLGPVGSKMPTKFQRQPTRAPDIFTHRIEDAYAAPQ